MHSWPIMVESMSARNNFLRRPPRGCTTTSIGRPPSAARRPFGDVAGIDPSPVEGMSAATPVASQSAEAACGNARAQYRDVHRSRRRVGSDCDEDMRVATNIRAVLIAGPTASGKSALALELGAGDRRRHPQRRLDAGLSRPAHHHRAADAGRGAERSASPLRSSRRRRELFGRHVARRCRGGAGGTAREEHACRSSSAAPGFISRR